jgi:hypothetical protein
LFDDHLGFSKTVEDLAVKAFVSQFAIEEATCRELTKRTNLLWSQMISDCDRKQRSFDDEQTKMLLGQQFYIDALRGSSTQ